MIISLYMYDVHMKINYSNIQTTYTQLLLYKKKKRFYTQYEILFIIKKNTILNIVY